MNKDRIIGKGEKIAGKAKDAFGRIIGDAKLQLDGKAEHADGKVRNAAGSAKDALAS